MLADLKKDYAAYAAHLELSCLSPIRRPIYLLFESTFAVVLCFRLSRSRRRIVSLVGRLAYRLARIVSGIQIPSSAKIGGGLLIPHYGTIVVNRRAVIGERCTILHNVTVGAKGVSEDAGLPVIGNDVYIGAGASVLGEINVGDGAVIGASAVVVKDVAAETVVGGNPARVLGTRVAAAKEIAVTPG